MPHKNVHKSLKLVIHFYKLQEIYKEKNVILITDMSVNIRYLECPLTRTFVI